MTATKNAIVKATAVKAAPTRDNAVVTEISAAGDAHGSMLSHVKAAAARAAKQLDAKMSVNERINLVMALYASDFAQVNSNIKSLFKDALTLHACSQAKVVISTTDKAGKKVDKTIGAKQALDLTQSVLREAAKQARASEGMGRAAGGGRKAVTQSSRVEKAEKGAGDNKATKSEVDQFSAWVDALPGYLADPLFNTRVTAALIASGYVLTKASKGRAVVGAATF